MNEFAMEDAETVSDSGGFSAVKWFVLSAGTFLMLTGFAKIWSVFGSAKLLAVEDPLVGIPFRYLLLAVGVLETVIGCVCFFSKNRKLAACFVACLATNLLVYRLSLWWINWHSPCHCLGNLTDALHIPPQTADIAMKIVLGYLLVGSYATLFWLWKQRKKAVPILTGLEP
jgi:hypothetical protein